MVTESQRDLAMISSYHKDEELVSFARGVSNHFDLLSSGGTFQFLINHGLTVLSTEEYTGMPAILDHRVVTLHPKIHGGFLARNTEAHRKEMQEWGIRRISLLYNTVYPLIDEIVKEESTPESVLEQTDIGGPAMLRSAAKGRAIVCCDPRDRQDVLRHLEAGTANDWLFLLKYASKAEALVGEYTRISRMYMEELQHDHLYVNWQQEQSRWHEQFG